MSYQVQFICYIPSFSKDDAETDAEDAVTTENEDVLIVTDLRTEKFELRSTIVSPSKPAKYPDYRLYRTTIAVTLEDIYENVVKEARHAVATGNEKFVDFIMTKEVPVMWM